MSMTTPRLYQIRGVLTHPLPVASVAHHLLQYGAIVDENFYHKLRAARALAAGAPAPDSDTEDISGDVPTDIQCPGG